MSGLEHRTLSISFAFRHSVVEEIWVPASAEKQVNGKQRPPPPPTEHEIFATTTGRRLPPLLLYLLRHAKRTEW